MEFAYNGNSKQSGIYKITNKIIQTLLNAPPIKSQFIEFA